MKRLIGIIITILCINLWSALSSAAPQSCRYISEGAVEQTWKKIRMQNAAGEIVGGADNFSQAIQLAQGLLDAQLCRVQLQDCRLASEGMAGGTWHKHRIQMDNEMIFGSDEIASALRQLSALRRLGFCQ